MKLFGLEIRRVPAPLPEPTIKERFAAAVDEVNDCWEAAQAGVVPYRPWIDWDNREMVLTTFRGVPKLAYTTEGGWE